MGAHTKQQLIEAKNAEIRNLQAVEQELREVLKKFKTCQNNIDNLRNQGSKAAVVGLSSSLFIDVDSVDVQKVLVEIGQGFSAELPLEEAIAFFKRREEKIKKQMTEVEKQV